MCKPGLRCFYFFDADLPIFLQPSYIKAGGKSLSSSIPWPKLHVCYICVTLVYLLQKYMINVAFMWHNYMQRLWHNCTYVWHIHDMKYSICWICNYVWDICEVYVFLVRVDSQLVAIPHSVHMICIFSFL